jgi:3-hydroxy-9,10-secoandrosta-1,3,5(10)-triene-9,17-dione monooxygenase reductase component
MEPRLNGAPALQGVLATIEADVEFEHDAGDHTIVVAHVTSLGAHPGCRPLLFYRGGYGGFA